MKAMIIERFDKKFHKLYFLMKAYWYGGDGYNKIKDFDTWSNDMLDDLLSNYSGSMIMKEFIDHVEKELDKFIDSHIRLLN